jgi:hypothetical protein
VGPENQDFCSVADLGCLSQIPDPDFYPSRIPDPDLGSRIPDSKTATKERGEKNSCHTFLCSHKFHKIVNYFSFEVLNYITFYQKNCQKALKNMVLGSGIRKKSLFRILDPGVKKAPDPDPQHCFFGP